MLLGTGYVSHDDQQGHSHDEHAELTDRVGVILRVRVRVRVSVRVKPRVGVRARARGGYFQRLHTPFSIVGVMSQPRSLG